MNPSLSEACPYPGYVYVNVDGVSALRRVLEKPAFQKAEQSVAITGSMGSDRRVRGAPEPAPWGGVPFPAEGEIKQDWSSADPMAPEISYKPDMGKVQPREDEEAAGTEIAKLVSARRQALLDRIELSAELGIIFIGSFLALFVLSHTK